MQEASKLKIPGIHRLPPSVSFSGRGLFGYTFGPLRQKDVEFYYIEVEKGHDTFMVSRKITRTYYVLSGSGYFTVDNRRYDVSPGMLVEVPPKVEYSYSGKMTLLALSMPRWFGGNDTHTRWNPDVVRRENYRIDRPNRLTQLVRLRVFGRSPVGGWLRLNRVLWTHLPSSFTRLAAVRKYGNFLNALARLQSARAQASSTYFLRNRPELELIGRLLETKGPGETLKVTVLGCSNGSEAYSVAWRIRSARPDLKLVMNGVDISKEAVECARRGIYSSEVSKLIGTVIFERMTPAEIEEMFDRNGGSFAIKPWIKEGTEWRVDDAGEPEILEVLGLQDIVVANNFLCHMEAAEAERCLRNIGRLVAPGGHLFVSGIDLDVRTKVARDMGWKPVEKLLEQVHEGDPCLRGLWPWHYAGLEPLNKKRPDWKIRYAAAFEIARVEAVPGQYQNELAMADR